MSKTHLRILHCAAWLWLCAGAGAEIWDGWHGPLADGFEGVRFGMDRQTSAELLSAAGYEPAYARLGTLRFTRKLDGQNLDVLAEFVDDARSGEGGRLCRVRLLWESLDMPTNRALLLFQHWESQLQARYDEPFFSEEDGAHYLEAGKGRFVRLYRGPEMQAVLELRAVRPELFRMLLTLDSPQLQPELPGD